MQTPHAATRPETSSSSSSPVERLRDQAGTIAEDVRELGTIAREGAQETLEEARARAGKIYEDQRRELKAKEERLVEMVREKPVQSLLISAGAGLVLGMFLRR